MNQRLGKKQIDRNSLLLFITIGLFVVMYGIGLVIFREKNFGNLQVFLNLFMNNAGVIVASAGMVVVLLIGGIDLSIGSVMGFTCMLLAFLIEKKGVNTYTAIVIGLLAGTVFGAVQGFLVSHLKIQPFIVTLAGMYFMRGMTAVVSPDMISITDETFLKIATTKFYIPFGAVVNRAGKLLYPYLFVSVYIALFVLLVLWFVLKYSKFGRAVYAIGGSEHASMLMGLNVKKVKFQVYMLNGFLGAMAGFLFCLNSCGGFTEQGKGLEMEALASAVIGGTLLSGGVGNVIGSLFGVMIKGTIESFITFQGSLPSSLTKISTAVLLGFFIILQSILGRVKKRK